MTDKMKIGKFYKHDKGRCIAVLQTVGTYRWGDMLVIEETDRTGHGISCVEIKDAVLNDNWTEIGKAEFMREFNAAKA